MEIGVDPGCLEGLLGDPGVILGQISQSVTALEAGDHGVDRQTGSGDDRLSTLDLRVSGDAALAGLTISIEIPGHRDEILSKRNHQNVAQGEPGQPQVSPLERALATKGPALVEVPTSRDAAGPWVPGWWDFPVPAYITDERQDEYWSERAEEQHQ